MNPEQQLERQDKILTVLKLAYARMLEFKRYKNSEVVMQKGKIMRLKP